MFNYRPAVSYTHLDVYKRQAQVLAQNSPVLLLDEPTSHLDINFQIEFMNLFLSLNKNENKTIIGKMCIRDSGKSIRWGQEREH